MGHQDSRQVAGPKPKSQGIISKVLLAPASSKESGPLVGLKPTNGKSLLIGLALKMGLSDLGSSSGITKLELSMYTKELLPVPRQSALVQTAPASVTVVQTMPARASATTNGKQAIFALALSLSCAQRRRL